MGTRTWQVAMLAGLAVGLALPLSAQEAASPRRGFWLSGGLGYGGAVIGCDGCQNDRQSGGTGFIALGGTLNPHFRLGAESDAWLKEQHGVSSAFGTLVLVGYFYPSPTGRFFLKGGAGLANVHLSGFGQSEDHEGFGVLFGVGTDVPVGSKISLTPTAAIDAGFLGAVDGVRGVNFSTLQLGLGVTYR
jgi:hypothetical protein